MDWSNVLTLLLRCGRDVLSDMLRQLERAKQPQGPCEVPKAARVSKGKEVGKDA